LSKKLLMKFVARMSGVSELQEHPWQISPMWVWGWGRSLWDLDLISNTPMKLGSAHGRKVLAIKAHVNTWVVMCKQWCLISLKQS